MADENVGLRTGTFGQLYAKSSGVSAIAADLIAKFRGGWTVSIEQTFAEWYGQQTVRQQAILTKLDISLSVAEVAFKPGNLDKLWNITKNAADNILSAAAPAATSYTFDYTVKPEEMEYLVECELDSKIFQAHAESAKIMSPTFNFSNEDFVVFNLDIILYGASGTLLNLLIEN